MNCSELIVYHKVLPYIHRYITRNRSLSNIGRASETALFRRQFHQLHDILVLTMKQMSYYAVCTFESAVARHIELAQ